MRGEIRKVYTINLNNIKMKKLIRFGLASLIVLCVTACGKDDPITPAQPNPDKPVVSEGLFVLNQGNYYSGIEGSLNVIDYNSETSRLSVFEAANHRSIGATPQCGVAYGSKIYLGIYESNTIEIIERNNFKSVKQIKLDETGQNGTQPRFMIADGGKIYISMFDGYVSRLDTVSMTIDASVKVGPNPEIMALYNGKLYVPNSDGMSMSGSFGKTASEINLASFTVTKTFDVPENPTQFFAAKDGLYLLCMGNYYDVEASLYKIGSNFEVKSIAKATLAETGDDCIYIINDPFYGMGQAEYKKYDINTGELEDWNIDRPEYANSLYYDSTAQKLAIYSLKYYGNIWPSYVLPGYVAIYDKDGNHIRDYETGSGAACIFKNAE